MVRVKFIKNNSLIIGNGCISWRSTIDLSEMKGDYAHGLRRFFLTQERIEHKCRILFFPATICKDDLAVCLGYRFIK